MAVVAWIKRSLTQVNWIGPSSETKPATGNSVGDTAFEVDTGLAFVWDGDTWEPMPLDGGGGGSGAAASQVHGNVAHDLADVGNPVKTGGKVSSGISPTSVATGDRVDALFDHKGRQVVINAVRDGTAGVDGVTQVTFPIDFNDVNTSSRPYVVAPFRFNGTSWDRLRGNVDATILASAARTASVDSADQTNYNGKGLHLVIDVTAITATPSITVTIQGKDPLSGKYYTILAAAAITGVSTVILKVYPALTAAANLTASDILPRTWRVSVVNADADSITYSIGASLIL